ncbi:MAG: nitroreductase family protein [Clostridiales Family XIII bacterium]|jgi:nitroreductase|nr:nitroreductase family protein [Clostridiales Family XIII bacterium]
MEFSELITKRQSIRKYKEADVPDDALLEMLGAARIAPSGKNMQNWHFVVIKRKDLIDKIADAVLKCNEEISSGMEARGVDGTEADKANIPQGAGVAQAPDRFRKFVRNFTLFFTNAPVLVVVMGQTYLPTGYREMEAAGADDDALRRHAHLASPGMQSLGAAVEHLMLKAVEMGYGGCWLTSANYAAKAIEEIVVNETDFPYALLRNEEKSSNEPVIGGIDPTYENGWFMASLISLGVPEDGAKSPGRKPLEKIMTLVK